jgi:hypothetical protein
MSETKYKNVVDTLLKAIDDTWTNTLEKSKSGEIFEIKLPIKKIDEVSVHVYFKIQRIVDGCYIRINIVSSNIIMKGSFYSKNFKHGDSTENQLYSFFNDLEKLKLNYYGYLSTKEYNVLINVLNSFNGLVIEGVVFDDIDDKKCCVCTNLTLTTTCCNHRYCFRCRSKNIEITKTDICPICRNDLKYDNYDGCNCNDEDDEDDEDYEDDDDEVCSGCGCIHSNDEDEDDDDDEENENEENDVNEENENKDN